LNDAIYQSVERRESDMDIVKVEGNNKGDVFLYALSTCIWCKKTKRLLDELGVAYSYVYVDLLEGDELEMAKKDIMKYNPECSFPTMVINGASCILGFKEEEIRKVLG
jgi:glutaredoxin-like protein NrdH